MQTAVRVIATTITAFVIFGGGAGVGYFMRDAIVNDQPTAQAADNFALYWEAWNRVQEQFYGQIPGPTITTYGAIKGSLATLDDPYTVFIEPEPAAHEKAQLEGQFGGIGAYVQADEEGRIILNPMPGQAAEKAGLRPNDVLIAVDGAPITAEMAIDQVVALIRGEVGTNVTLTIEREGATEPINITIERAVIETPSANWRLLEEDPTIGYIQLTAFTERSAGEMTRALEELAGQGAETYIFDLRSNGGGLLEAAVDIASMFLEDGLVLREDRKNEGERVYEVRDNVYKLTEAPLVLLVNGGTASASEIVAGALQDQGRATLIGEKTFGKGSVQLIYELSDASRLHVTVAKWFTPDNHAIDGTGLQPQIEALFTEADHASGRDVQLERAIEFLKKGE